MATLSRVIILFLFCNLLMAQLPDYFEYEGPLGHDRMTNITPFQGGFIYATNASYTEGDDITQLMHWHGDGTLHEIQMVYGSHETCRIEVQNGVAIIAIGGVFDCDYPPGDLLYTYDGQVTQMLTYFEYQDDIIFHPQLDTVYGLSIYGFPDSDLTKYSISTGIGETQKLPKKTKALIHGEQLLYGISEDDEVYEIYSGETLISEVGEIFDYHIEGNELLLVADSIYLIDLSSGDELRVMDYAGTRIAPSFRGKVIAKVEDRYVFRSLSTSGRSTLTALNSDDEFELVYTEQYLNLRFSYLHYDGDHYYTGHNGRVIRKSKELDENYPYERSDVGLELNAATMRDTFAIGIGTMDTIARNYLELSVDLTNHGTQPIDHAVLKTNSYRMVGWDCGYEYHTFYLEEELLPGESVTLETETIHHTMLSDSLAVYVYGADYKLDENRTDDVVTTLLSSTSEIISSAIKFYPNPTQDKVMLEFERIGNYQLELFTCDGVSFNEIEGTRGDKIEIDVSLQPPGFYFVRVLDRETTQSEIFKLVKL